MLAAAALIVMIGRVPIGDALTRAIVDHDGLPQAVRAFRISHVQEWIMDVPQNAAKRAVLIGAARTGGGRIRPPPVRSGPPARRSSSSWSGCSAGACSACC